MEKPLFVTALEKNAPELLPKLQENLQFITTDSALPAKVKLLMAAVVDAIKAHPEGVKNLIKMAREKGATDEEIQDTLRFILAMDGLPGFITGISAYL
ncbi:MAG: carboxymuconolactone decarboxylase family protein [Candidatus Tectomicrobia bacterium]|uniref:Carboxymuconolactone decarboxylase family protein n=1 Tax=Tectimicrobiota bacterium TaxID=2528274 RepID=A0A932FZD0_UNCTE|nr:carboxymuconolactone decarboxylase family protein [Candidatus Tectomicrobia bacterium]